MTRDARVGRVLVAALQQAIADELPTRSEFYDHWLGPDGRRDGTLGIAPMTAVVGFLRTEGDRYHRVMARAGRLVAEWTWDERPAWRRSWLTRLPRWWRARSVARLVRAMVSDTCPATVARCRVSRNVVVVDVDDSVFCSARETPEFPLCGFYAALVIGAYAAAGMDVSGAFERCRSRPGQPTDRKGSGCGGAFTITLAG